MFKLSPLQCVRIFYVLVVFTLSALMLRVISKSYCDCGNDSKRAPITDTTTPTRRQVVPDIIHSPDRQAEHDSKCSSAVENSVPEWEKKWNFTGFDNETGTADGRYIIPNYVHFVKFRHATFTFVHTVCLLAALKNQRPEKLFIHTDVQEFQGENWQILLDTPGFKEVRDVAIRMWNIRYFIGISTEAPRL